MGAAGSSRRVFLRNSGTVAAGVGLTANSGIARAASSKGKGLAAGRAVYPINRGWRYSPRVVPGADAATFDDAAWTEVIVPHSNIPLPWHGFNDKTYEFVSMYRRHLKLPADLAGKRVFVDFEGVMLATTVSCNGKKLGAYKGGYTPFSFELTGLLQPAGDNVLSLEVDSTERPDIPPFGYEVDYLTFGGLYREVALRVVPEIFLENIHAQGKDVLSADPKIEVACYLDRARTANPGPMTVAVQLRDGDTEIARGTARVTTPPVTEHHEEDADQAMGALPYNPAKDGPAATVTLSGLAGKVKLWDLDNPTLYTVHVQLLENGHVLDEDYRRIGLREATFTPQGFSLNGEVIKLHGLDRHQTFPWVGQAMPGRVQRQDVAVLKKEMNCNIVRTSHYPQSPHFLDACDEMGLLVLEEIPGWQHIGDLAWQDISVDNVRRMVRRDWNRPSIVLWGVRINESQDDHDFYTRTNNLAHALDTGRQTGGIRYLYNTELLEDVMTMNDFGWPLRKPNHPRYLNTEFVGHTFPTKTIDLSERQTEHTIRHARVHDQLASDPQYAGGIGWCAFDYTTHANFGSGDRICYHGVMDIFRTPKPAAGFYKSMIDPKKEIVIEPAFHWARNDESVGITYALICSNVEHIKLYTVTDHGETLVGEGDPDRKQFAHLKYAPFSIELQGKAMGAKTWGDLRMDGYIGGKKVISRTLAGDGVDQAFKLLPDGTELLADGADTVRVVLRAEDKYGNVRPFAADGIELKLDGPATLIGDNPFGLIGGTGAVWLRAGTTPGTVTLTGKHPRLPESTVTFTLAPAPAEQV